MDAPRSRRQVLRALAAGGAAVAGCTGDRARTTPSTRRPTTTTATATTTTTETTETHGSTSGPDERETRTPPGAPELDPGGEWPTLGFDAANTGYDPHGTGLRDAERYWRLDAGGPASLHGGTLYNVHDRDREYAALTRRDPATAAVQSATRLVQYGVNSPPTVAAGRVYVATFIEVLCLAPDRDEVLWRGPEMDGVHGTPTVHDGTVYVNSGGFQGVQPHVRAFDAASGEEQWRYDTGSESKGTPAVAGGRVFVNSRDGLHAIDAATGDRAFVVPDAAYDWATPAATADAVYTTAYRDDGVELLAIDAADGTVRWRVPADPTHHGPPVVAGDIVYAGTDDGVVALAADGTKIASLGGAGAPVARVGSVVYAADGGVLYALDAHAGELWSHTTEQVRVEDTVGRAISGVTPVDGAVYVSARDGFHGLGPTE